MYFEKASLWNREPEPYQIQTRQAVLSLIPQTVSSILDVGCGDGFITNELPEPVRVVGLDISESALKHVRRETVRESVSNMPFEPCSFDLVMANDTLEHLPEDIYAKGVSEIFRVARNWVLITVPYAEQLSRSTVTCNKCGERHHINLHFREYSEESLRALCPSGWMVCEIRYTGDVTRPPYDLQVDSWPDYAGDFYAGSCECLRCGSQIDRGSDGTTRRLLNTALSKRLYGAAPHILVDRSEVSVLFGREPWHNTGTHQEVVRTRGSLLVADLSNPLQAVRGFVEGSQWTRYRINKGSENETIWLQFPTVTKEGDMIVVRDRENEQLNSVLVCGHDSVESRALPLSLSENSMYMVARTWTPTQYGTIVTVHAPVGSVGTVEYVPTPANERFIVPFLTLCPGHTVITDSTDVKRSWCLFTDTGGSAPMPLWLDAPDKYTTATSAVVGPVEVLREFESYTVAIEKERAKLGDLLERTEALRSEAEQAYSALEREHQQEVRALISRVSVLEDEKKQLNDLLEATESQRELAEKAYALASRHLTKAEDARIRTKAKRVLVLSHLFPNHIQPNLGCFVADQVQAIRVHEGIDVRVISCLPFWCNAINPIRIFRALRRLRSLNRNATWTEFGGIPVLQLYYLVGLPLWPFEFHASTYRSAVASVIDSVRREFKFQLVHAHTGYEDGATGLFISQRYGVPLVITEHTGPFSRFTSRPLVRKVALTALSSAQKVMCVSPALEFEVGRWVKTGNLMTIPNCVDTEFFRPSETNKRPSRNLLSVISLDSNKNPFGLIQAFEQALSCVPGATLTIAGGGPLETQVRAVVHEKGLPGSIRILGWQPKEEIARLMRECDAFVLPSHSETFAVVVAEGLASGKPVISTKCGGPEATLSDPLLGELVPVNNPSALAQAMVKVLANLEAYPQSYIRDIAVEKFSLASVARKVAEVYESVLGDSTR